MKHYHLTSGKTDQALDLDLPNFAGIYIDREELDIAFENIYKQIILNTFEFFESSEEMRPYSRSIRITGYVLAGFECNNAECHLGE